MADTITLPPDFMDAIRENLEKRRQALGQGEGVALSSEEMQALIKDTHEQLEIQKARAKAEAKIQSKLEQQAEAFLMLNKPSLIQAQVKSIKYWDKFVVKNKFFEKTLDLLKQGLAKAGSFLMDLLKSVLFLAIFDPKGKMAVAIINMLTKVFLFVIDLLVKLIPRILDAIFIALPNIAKTLWNAFWKISNKIGDAIIKIIIMGLERLQKEFGDLPFFSAIIDFFKSIGPDVKEFIGALILFGGILAKFKMLGTVISLIGKVLSLLSSPAFAVVAAIGSLVALFVYAEEVVAWFESTFQKLWNWFESSSEWVKILVSAIAGLLGPITLAIAGIYALTKLFKFFKEVDWEVVWKSTVEFFTKTIPDIFIWLIKKWLPKKIKEFEAKLNRVFDFLMGLWDNLKNFVMSIFSFDVSDVKRVLINLVDSVFGYGFTKRISNKIIEAFSYVTDFLKGFTFWILGKLANIPVLGERMGLGSLKGLGDLTVGQNIQAAQLSRQSGASMTQTAAIVKAREAIQQGNVNAELRRQATEQGVDLDRLAEIVNSTKSDPEIQRQMVNYLHIIARKDGGSNR